MINSKSTLDEPEKTSKTTEYVVIGIVVLLLLGGVGFFIYKKRHSGFGKRRRR